VLGKAPPNLAWIVLNGATVDPPDAEILQLDALAVEHPVDVVIGDDEELRGIFERFVLGEPARIGVTMRRYDRQVAHAVIEPAGYGARFGIGGQQAILMQQGGL